MKTVSLPRGRQRLHTMPTSTGYEIRTDSSYNWDGRKRGQTPFTVLQHTITGAGNLRYENRNYRVRAGRDDAVLVPHNHRYWLEEGGRWEFFWISMHGEEALRIHQDILNVTGPIFKLQPETIDHLADCSLRLIQAAATRRAAPRRSPTKRRWRSMTTSSVRTPCSARKSRPCSMSSTISAPISTSRCRSRSWPRFRA